MGNAQCQRATKLPTTSENLATAKTLRISFLHPQRQNGNPSCIQTPYHNCQTWSGLYFESSSWPCLPGIGRPPHPVGVALTIRCKLQHAAAVNPLHIFLVSSLSSLMPPLPRSGELLEGLVGSAFLVKGPKAPVPSLAGNSSPMPHGLGAKPSRPIWKACKQRSEGAKIINAHDALRFRWTPVASESSGDVCNLPTQFKD